MFDIKIGTLIPADDAVTMIPQLNPKGFECYELDMNSCIHKLKKDFPAYAESLKKVTDGRTISTCGLYGNTLVDTDLQENIAFLIRNAHLVGCNVVSVFAGGNPEKSVPDTIPEFREVFKRLTALAEDCGVRLALEGCGGGWWGDCTNMAYCEDAWELMFAAVDSPALGLEWEPSHAWEHLCDPIPQLRRWAKKVVHIHGKDSTVAWDVIRDYGIDGKREYQWNRTPGFGDTNWADVFTILLQNGFVGACDIEGYHDPVHYDDMEWTAQLTGLEYLKRCRGGISFFDGPTEYRGYQGSRKG